MPWLAAAHDRQHRLAVGGAGDGTVHVTAEAGAVVQQGVRQQGVAGGGPVEGAAHHGGPRGRRLGGDQFADAPLGQGAQTHPAVRPADQFGVGCGVTAARMAGCRAHHEDGTEAAPAEQVDDGVQGGLVHQVGVVHGQHQGALAVRQAQQRLRRRDIRIAEFRAGPPIGIPGGRLCVSGGQLCVSARRPAGARRNGQHLTVAQQLPQQAHRPVALGRVCRPLEYACARPIRSGQKFVQKLGLPGTGTTGDYHESPGSSGALGKRFVKYV